MSKRYGTRVYEINGVFEIYFTEEHKFSIYVLQESESGRRTKKLLKADIDSQEEALKICRQLVNKAYEQINH